MTGPGEGATVPHDDELVQRANKAYERAELQNMRAMQDDAVDFGYADDRDPMVAVIAAVTPLIEARVRQQIADNIWALVAGSGMYASYVQDMQRRAAETALGDTP